MSLSTDPQAESLRAILQTQLQRARANPFLLSLLLKQWQRVLNRLAYFYAQLASLPRRQRRALQRALATSLIGAALLLALSSAPIVHAGTIAVNGDGSGGTCSLSDAITTANTGTDTGNCTGGSLGADTIDLQTNVTLSAPLPNITTEIRLEGNGFSISGANLYRVLYVQASGDLTIDNATIKDGYAYRGGAVYNEGTLTINDSTLSGNRAANRGGAVFNDGTLTINTSTLSGNSSTYDNGGAIFNNTTLTINNSTLSGNHAANRGGAIFNNTFATLTLTNSTLSGNSANSDDGGAILNANYATLTLNRTLISGNTATGDGDEIYNEAFGSITANNYNLFGHSGITNAQAFSVFTPGANDFNATSDGDGTSTHVPTALASILNTTLANNGGFTQTHALVTGSPALDKAPNTDCYAAPVDMGDQRGFPRNIPIGHPPTSNDCDIGAFELQTPTAVNVTGLRGSINRNGNVVIQWRTVSENQIAGFNVYRQGKQGKWKQRNAQFKPTKHPGDTLGDKYRFTDKNVKPGKTYRYKIEVHYLDGHTEWTNVVKVKTP